MWSPMCFTVTVTVFIILIGQRLASPDINERKLRGQLDIDPTNVDALRELGLLSYLNKDNLSAQKYLALAIEHSNYQDKTAVWNYVNALYYDDQGEKARLFIEEYYHTHSKDIDTVLLAGRMNLCNGQVKLAQERFQEALSIYPDRAVISHQILLFYEEAMVYAEAESFLRQTLQLFPRNALIVFQSGILLFNQGRVEDALVLFEQVLELDFDRKEEVTLMVAATHQALGNTDLAKDLYKRIYQDKILDPSSSSYVSFLSNYGLLLKSSKDDAEADVGLQLIHDALKIDPYFETALINLAMHYRVLDDIDEAVVYLKRAAEVSSNTRQLEIDIAANTMDEVMTSWSRVLAQRREMIHSLTRLLSKGPPLGQHFHEYNILNLHFNIQYHSFNDKHIQELIYNVYEMNIKHFSRISPRLLLEGPLEVAPRHHNAAAVVSSAASADAGLSSPSKTSGANSRIRIGFISKLFGVFEPHGLLLDGIVKYLPRSHFKVYVLRILLDKESAGHVTSPTLVDFADEVVDVPQTQGLAADLVEKLALDVLVFADALCEPVNHLLMFSRYAKIQILFWGNPITSGSPQVDYFMSSNYMEHPFRSRMSSFSAAGANISSTDPYTEQVVLLPGQGIWYMNPYSPEFQKSVHILENKTARVREFSREEFGLDSSWFVYLCPQNLFKLHVFFDDVINSILEKSQLAHVVFTIPGRKKGLTEKFKNRLQTNLAGNFARCHFLPRVSSEQFIKFIGIGDVLLHPFPFDGSRISADSITAGIPYVTLPAEYLKGRMGASFYRTMNIPELVAANMRALIVSRSWLIFDDMEVPFAWSQFLLRAVGEKSLSWTEFLASCSDRDVKEETYRSDLRLRNQEQFDARRGPEWWLLDAQGRVVLEEDVTGYSPPRIFNDWNHHRRNTSGTILQNGKKGGIVEPITAADISLLGEALNNDVEFPLSSKKFLHEEVFNGKQHADVYERGLHLLQASPGDVLLNYQMGAIQYLHGDYEGAFFYCGTAVELLLAKSGGEEDAQLYGCLGLAASRLGVEDISLFALNRAWELREVPSRLLGKTSQLLLPPSDTHSYFLNALFKSGRYVECVEAAMTILALPRFLEGGAHMLAFSQVSWTQPTALALLHEVDETMKQQGRLNFPNVSHSPSILSETRRLQSSSMTLVDTALTCSQNLEGGAEARHDVENVLIHLSQEESPASLYRNNGDSKSANAGIALVIPWAWGRRAIAATTTLAIALNVMNPFISDIFLLTSSEVDLSTFSYSLKLHQYVTNHTKGSLLFESIFDFVNEALRDRVVIIAKADIYFDQSLEPLANRHTPPHIDKENNVFALTAWRNPLSFASDSASNSFLDLSFRVTREVDAWVLRSPVRDCVVKLVNFLVGAPRAGQRLAALFEQCNCKVTNPSYFVRAIAVDGANVEGEVKGADDSATSYADGVDTASAAPIEGQGNFVLLSDSLPFL